MFSQNAHPEHNHQPFWIYPPSRQSLSYKVDAAFIEEIEIAFA
jgi:hypothetical protein